MTCSLVDRNLARKYGLNEGLLRSVMDMPGSHSQSIEQARESTYTEQPDYTHTSGAAWLKHPHGAIWQGCEVWSTVRSEKHIRERADGRACQGAGRMEGVPAAGGAAECGRDPLAAGVHSC